MNENKSLGADKIDEALLSLIPNDKIGFLLPNAQKSIQINVKEAVLFKEIDFKVENEVKDDFGRQYTIWHHDALTSRNKNWLLTKLRNGIAHQHIKAINTPDNTKWTGIKLWNVAKSYHCSGNYKDFEITLTIEQLTKLARHIAQSVLPIS